MTESDTQAELFAAIQSLAGIIPEMRAGQLVAAAQNCALRHARARLWDADDQKLLGAAWQFRRNYEAACADSERSRRGRLGLKTCDS